MSLTTSWVWWGSYLAVSWLERGDPSGQPVIHFHGWPSSRLEQFAGDDLLREFGLRWFSLDRPGYGSTRFNRNHTFAQWAATVSQWADHQGLKEFHVSGFSGGGPFAQAVAAQLKNRVLSLTLIASLAPFGADGVPTRPPWAGVREQILNRAPWMAEAGFRMFNAVRRKFPDQTARFQVSLLHPLDQVLLNNVDTRQRVREVSGEAMKQGVRHIIEDLHLYRRQWDFDPGVIQCPTSIWVGDQDRQVPADCSYWLAGRITGSRLKVFRGEAHYIALRHAPEILSAIRESAKRA